MTAPLIQLKARLRERLTTVLGSATAGQVVEAVDLVSQVPAVVALLDELQDQSVKVAQAAMEALPEFGARAGFGEVATWLDLCVTMAESSGATTLKLIKESPWLVALIEGVEQRAKILGLALEFAERDANVALEFLRAAPELSRAVTGNGLSQWTDVALELTERDYVLGLEFFRESPRIAAVIPLDDVRSWIEFGLRLVSTNQFGKTDYFATIEYLRTSPALLKEIADPASRRLVIRLVSAMAQHQPQMAIETLAEAPALLGRIEQPAWQQRMLQYGLFVVDRDVEAARNYLRRCPEIVGWLGYDERATHGFEEWFKSGMDVLAYSVDGARAYFALETKQALSQLQEAQSGVPLRQVARSLKLFVQALCGRDIAIQELSASEPGTTRIPRATVSADGRTLFLPPIVRRHPDREQNVRAYTVMAAHEAGHLEFGTYELRFEDIPDVIEDVARRYGRQTAAVPQSLAALFALYPQPGVMRDLWTILEDARVEHLLRVHYPGLRDDLAAVTREAVTTRSLSQGMSFREMILDGLLIQSAAIPDVAMPDSVREVLSTAWALCAPVLGPTATAADVVRTADRVYVALDELVGTYQAPAGSEAPPAAEVDRRVTQAPEAAEAIETEYRPLENWNFRGAMNPELIGVGEADRPAAHPQGTNEREAIGPAARSRQGGGVGQGQLADGDPQALGNESAPHASADEVAPVPDARRARWEAAEAQPGQYHYDEWDGMLRDYRAHWCRVVERVQTAQNPDFAEEVLQQHGPSVRLLRRYFESIRPPAFRAVRGVAEGDDIDLDAAIRLRTDLAAGAEPSDRLYVRHERRERDVAVAFLVDLSGSTSRQIEGEGRRVIDVEKAGLILLCEALEAVGDHYAIYGYSGKGRRQVDVVVLKEFGTMNRAETAARIGAVEPQAQNRDGAAIRHVTRKLAATGARVKLLVLMSDGKPLDEAYADEYALEDTKMALREAGGQGVDCFCITVDRTAEASVRRMYGEVRFLVIDRVGGLPERLPRVYHSLTR